jgi:hypothetical protein
MRSGLSGSAQPYQTSDMLVILPDVRGREKVQR